MSQLLIEHAKRNVWQEPHQDFQYHIGLARLTPDGGFQSSYRVGWHRVLSPTRHEPNTKYYHVYQIGQLSDMTLNIVNLLTEDKWYRAVDMVNNHRVYIQVYMATGAIVPLSLVWLMRDFTNNLLVCIEHNPNVDYGQIKTLFDPVEHNPAPHKVTLDNTNLTIRFYSNNIQVNTAFNKSSRVPNDTVEVLHGMVMNQTEYDAFTARFATLKRKFTRIVDTQHQNSGWMTVFVDGFMVGTEIPIYTNSLRGKIITLVYDESYILVKRQRLKHMPVFKSKRDLNQNKYLMILNHDADNIDHHDDIDFYLWNDAVLKGLYIGRTHESHIRQVTHRSYAIDAQNIRSYINLYGWTDYLDDLMLVAHVRKGGMQKPPLSQANRVNELFRIPYLAVVNAYNNPENLIDVWKAPNLENSDYAKLMSVSNEEITGELVTNAYGYPGIVQTLLHPRLNRKAGSTEEWEIPEGITWPNPLGGMIWRGVWGYDAQGMYLGYYLEQGGSNTTQVPSQLPWSTQVANLEMFRLITATPSELSGVVVNADVAHVDLVNYGFACYVSVDGTNQWQDVTGSKYYRFLNADENKGTPKIAWNWNLLSAANVIPCVRINSHMLVYETTLTQPTNHPGYYAVTVQGSHLRGANKITGDYRFPVGKVDVFANGYSLIEGIDYYMDFPKLVINNQLIAKSNPVKITVRCYGIADKTTYKRYPPTEIGFIRGRWLSADGKYRVARNRPHSLVVDSRRLFIDDTKMSSQLGGFRWNEYSDVDTAPSSSTVDGRPYMIQDYVIPVDHVATKTTSVLYREMLDTDEKVGDFLTQAMPERPVVNPRAITNRWQLVSPVLSALLHSMKLGLMRDSPHISGFSMGDVGVWMRSFEWLLPFDPAYHNIDPDYTYILPHPYDTPMSCTINQYQFLEVVISLYLNDRIDLSKHVQVRAP